MYTRKTFDESSRSRRFGGIVIISALAVAIVFFLYAVLGKIS